MQARSSLTSVPSAIMTMRITRATPTAGAPPVSEKGRAAWLTRSAAAVLRAGAVPCSTRARKACNASATSGAR